MDSLFCLAELYAARSLGPCFRLLPHPSTVKFLQSDIFFHLGDYGPRILTGEGRQGGWCVGKGNRFFFWLHWVFAAAHELSLVVVSRGYSSLWCAGFSLWWLLLLWSLECRHAGPVDVAHELSSSAARGLFPDLGSNPRLPHW